MAIYNNILIEAVFSRVFLNKLLGKKNGVEELRFIDSALYKNLMQIKHSNVLVFVRIWLKI